MKKYIWLCLLIVGLVMIVVPAVNIIVPMITASSSTESVAIIGGADGPAAQYLTQRLFWDLLQGRIWIILAGAALVIVAVILKILQKKA